MNDLNSTSAMGWPDRLVANEIVLPGGPHECILGTETSPGYDILDWFGHFNVRGELEVFFESTALYDAFSTKAVKLQDWMLDLAEAVIVDPRTTRGMPKYPSRGSSLDVFLEARRILEPPVKKK